MPHFMMNIGRHFCESSIITLFFFQELYHLVIGARFWAVSIQNLLRFARSSTIANSSLANKTSNRYLQDLLIAHLTKKIRIFSILECQKLYRYRLKMRTKIRIIGYMIMSYGFKMFANKLWGRILNTYSLYQNVIVLPIFIIYDARAGGRAQLDAPRTSLACRRSRHPSAATGRNPSDTPLMSDVITMFRHSDFG